MSLTNQQKAEMALVYASDAIPSGSNAGREIRIARAALHIAAAMMERVLIEGCMWAGEQSIVEYFTTEVRKTLAAQEQKVKVEADRAWLLHTHSIAWDILRHEYFDKHTQVPVSATTIERLLSQREQEQPMATAGPSPDTILLPGALATGEYIRVRVTDQLGRLVPVIQSELEMRPLSYASKYPERELNFSIKVSTYSDDSVTRAAEQALVAWLKTLKHNDPRRTYIEQSLSNLTCGIFLLYSHKINKHIAVGVKEMTIDKTIRLLDMLYDGDAHYSVMESIKTLLGEHISLNWITETQ